MLISNDTARLGIEIAPNDERCDEWLNIQWVVPRESNKWRKLGDLDRLDTLLRESG
jgi:hypothetical protein